MKLPDLGATAPDASDVDQPQQLVPKRPKKPRSSSRTTGRPGNVTDRVGPDGIIAATCRLLRSYPPSEVTRVLAARASEVHPSLIHYYFKSRSSLMIAAAERLTVEFCEAVDRRMADVGGSPTERLRAKVEILVDLEMTNPYFHRLLIEEVLTSSDPAARALTQNLASRGMTMYQAIIDDGVASGELRDLDGGWLFTSVISLCQFFEKAKLFYRSMARPGASDAALEVSYRRFLVALVMNAVAVPENETTEGAPPLKAEPAKPNRKARSAAGRAP